MTVNDPLVRVDMDMEQKPGRIEFKFGGDNDIGLWPKLSCGEANGLTLGNADLILDGGGAIRSPGDLSIAAAGKLTVGGRNTVADGRFLDAHLAARDNPHGVSAAQVGALALGGGTVNGNLTVSGILTARLAAGLVGAGQLTADVSGRLVTGGDGHDHTPGHGAQIKHSDLTLDGGRNPHGTTAAAVGALALSGGELTGAVTIQGGLAVADYIKVGDRLIIDNAGKWVGDPSGLQGSWRDGAGSVTTDRSVGIGVTDPKAKLHVEGPSWLGGPNYSSHFPFTDNNAYITGKNIIFRDGLQSGFAEQMRITNEGRVGIGTKTPSHALHVASVEGLRQNSLYLSGGPGWSSFTYNAHHNATDNAWVFPDSSRPAMTVEMDDRGGRGRFEVHSTTTANKTVWIKRLAIDGETGATSINGNLTVQGDLTTIGTGAINGRSVAADGAKLDGHLAATNNPHGVTAAQIGALALSGGAVAGSLAVKGELIGHKGLKVGSKQVIDQEGKWVGDPAILGGYLPIEHGEGALSWLGGFVGLDSSGTAKVPILWRTEPGLELDSSGTATVPVRWRRELVAVQLTAIERPAPNLHVVLPRDSVVSGDVTAHPSFTIQGGEPGMVVAWQAVGYSRGIFLKSQGAETPESP